MEEEVIAGHNSKRKSRPIRLDQARKLRRSVPLLLSPILLLVVRLDETSTAARDQCRHRTFPLEQRIQ